MAAFSRKGRTRRQPFPNEGLRGVGRFGRMRSAGAVRAVGGRRRYRSVGEALLRAAPSTGREGRSEADGAFCLRGRAGNKGVVLLRGAGEAGEIRFCLVLRPGAECRNPLSSEASAVVEPGTSPSRRIGGFCSWRGRVRAKRMFPFVTDAHRRMVGLAVRRQRQPVGCRAAACRADFGFRLVIPESRFAGWDAGRNGSVSALPWRRDSGCMQPERTERVRRLRPDALCHSGGSASPWEGMRTGTGVFVLSWRAVRVTAEHRMDGMRCPRRAVSEDGPSRGERNFRSPRDGSKRSAGASFRSVALSLSAHDDEAPDYRAGAGFDVESSGEGGTGGPSSSARRV